MAHVSSIIQRLSDISTELASLYIEEAATFAHEYESKLRAWFGSQESTIAARDKESAFHALQPSLDLIHLKGQIRALSEERDQLRLELDYHTHAAP